MTLVVTKGLRLRAGRYELERQLGRGAAATVWLARDTLLERTVAVKILGEGLIEDRSWIARFKREARMAAGLQHANLVSIYDFEAEAERPYLVMAYLSGGSLAQRLASGGAPNTERLAKDILRALEHIHAAGIVHRDVKPGNVLLAPDGRACLSDFGVARPEDATAITQTGEVPGTARYMAPELWRGAPADERSDLFACGVLLSECLRDDCPAAVRDLAERLRAEHRELRPASAAEALRLLEAPAAPRADEAPTLIAPRPAPRGRRLAPLALCLAAIGTGAVVASTLGGGGGEPSRGTAHTTTTTRAKRFPAPASAAAKPPPVAPAADGAALNDRGHQLIRQGRYAEAVPVLQQAVSALQAGGGLDYAFALFNLGSALRLAGRPAEAIPILEQRLQIPNQTGAVQAELEQARRDLAAQGQGIGKVKKAKKPKGGPRARGD